MQLGEQKFWAYFDPQKPLKITFDPRGLKFRKNYQIFAFLTSKYYSGPNFMQIGEQTFWTYFGPQKSLKMTFDPHFDTWGYKILKKLPNF